MNWNQRYATGEVMGDISSKSATDLSSMAKDLNSHIFSYSGQSGQSSTDRMYKGMGGADLDNQPQLSNLRSKYNDSSIGSIGKAVQQIKLFTGRDSYGSDIRTNREKFPEFHSLMDQASPIAGGLSRGTVLTDVRHGTPGSPIDISQHYKVGDKMTTQVTSATSDPELAKNWVLDDKQRFDQAKSSGDNSVLDQKYNGARHGAFVVHHYPEGIKGLQVAPLSAVPEHNEVVPQAGQKLKVSRVEGPDESGVHHIYYEHDNDNDNNTMGTTSMNWNQKYANTDHKELYNQLTQYRDEHDRGNGDLAGFHEMYTGWLQDGMKNSILAARCGDIARHLSGIVDRAKGTEEDRHELWPSINIYKKLRSYHGNTSGKFNPSSLS